MTCLICLFVFCINILLSRLYSYVVWGIGYSYLETQRILNCCWWWNVRERVEIQPQRRLIVDSLLFSSTLGVSSASNAQLGLSHPYWIRINNFALRFYQNHNYFCPHHTGQIVNKSEIKRQMGYWTCLSLKSIACWNYLCEYVIFQLRI